MDLHGYSPEDFCLIYAFYLLRSQTRLSSKIDQQRADMMSDLNDGKITAENACRQLSDLIQHERRGLSTLYRLIIEPDPDPHPDRLPAAALSRMAKVFREEGLVVRADGTVGSTKALIEPEE